MDASATGCRRYSVTRVARAPAPRRTRLPLDVGETARESDHEKHRGGAPTAETVGGAVTSAADGESGRLLDCNGRRL